MQNVIAIFDIGKTNKKFYLFGQNYQILHQEEHNFAETEDEDGFPSEDLSAVAQWVTSTLRAAKADRRFQIKALNFSTYGASAVHLDDHNRVVTPLYNYLKPLEPQILEQLAQHHGQLEQLALDTACPMPLDNLNVGLQMYRLRCLRPDTFDRIHVSLHLPQYLSFLFTGVPTCAKSMIGCHSLLWDFDHDKYHPWALNAGVTQKFVPIRACTSAVQKGEMHIGPGMHDSAASLVPYMVSPSAQPFVLLSTGTWSIAMNPSNDQALTLDELRQGCLKYMNYLGKGVKSSRLFMGQEHEQQVNQIAAHFHVQPDFYKTVVYQPELAEQLGTGSTQPQAPAHPEGALAHYTAYGSAAEAYHALMLGLVAAQQKSLDLVLQTNTRQVFVSGGFARNPLYMNLLERAYPHLAFKEASINNASALGAALVLHHHWNSIPLESKLY